MDRHNVGPQADHELFARRFGVLARFGGNRFHQGIELFVGGFVEDVVQIEGLWFHQILREKPRPLGRGGRANRATHGQPLLGAGLSRLSAP